MFSILIKILDILTHTMKKLSETLTEMGIAFSFPIEIKEANDRVNYYEDSDDFWYRYEYDANRRRTYYEDSNGKKRGTPRSAKSAKTREGKVVEVDGIKYKLKAL